MLLMIVNDGDHEDNNWLMMMRIMMMANHGDRQEEMLDNDKYCM